MVLSKRDSKVHTRTNIGERWASFDQMRMIKMKIIDLDANNKSISTHMKTSYKDDNKKDDNSGYKLSKSIQKVKRERFKIGNRILKTQLHGKMTLIMKMKQNCKFLPNREMQKFEDWVCETKQE